MTTNINHLRTSKLLLAATAIGIVGSGIGWIAMPREFYFSYLTAWFFSITIVLGMLFFVMLQHVTDAGWSVVVRRPAEQFLAAIPLLAVLSIPLIVGAATHQIFEWSHAPDSHLLHAKKPFLNLPFLFARLAIYFAVFFLLARIMRGKSLAQDVSGDPALSLSMRRWSAPGFVMYAIAFTFLCIDWIMTLEYEWFSTIFGVYVWSGSAVAGLSLLSIIVVVLRKSPALKDKVHQDTLHDLGKLIFAFVVFWAYIAFSQFFLIWYANIPEETEFFIRRWQGPWKMLSVLLVAVRFVLPFVVMMSANLKRRPRALVAIGLAMLVGHYLDLYWLIMPARGADELAKLIWLDASTMAAVGGVTLIGVIRAMNRASLYPLNDPRLAEAIGREHHAPHAKAAH